MIELIVVLVVLGLVVTAAVPAYQSLIGRTRVEAAELQMEMILSEARAIRAQDRSLSWTEAIGISAEGIAPDGGLFHASGGELYAIGNADACSFPDGIGYGDLEFVCAPGEGTHVTDGVLHADPTRWTLTTDPGGWSAISLHTRHLVVHDGGDVVVVQLAAGSGVWVYGRLQGNGMLVHHDSPATTTTSTTTTTPAAPDPEPTTTTAPPVDVDPDEDDETVWPEEGDPEDEDVIDDVVDDSESSPGNWWVDRGPNHCKLGGWASSHPSGLWKNQGDCQSFYSTNGHNLPSGPLAHLYPTP